MYTTTLTGVLRCFFLSCKANARVKHPKTGHGPHSSKLVIICVVRLLFVLFCVLFMCKCVLYYCHRVLTQLQLTNTSYHKKRNIRDVKLTTLLQPVPDEWRRITPHPHFPSWCAQDTTLPNLYALGLTLRPNKYITFRNNRICVCLFPSPVIGLLYTCMCFIYPLSYGVPVRERYGSTLLPATREQHDQNCTQSH